MKSLALHLNTLIATLLLTLPLSADWPNWRGPDGTGTTEKGDDTSALDSDQLQWSFTLPGKGCSTPIVYDQRIYVTAPAAGNDALISINADGTEAWSVEFGEETPGKHRNGSGSNSSPVIDSSGIYVYYKSGTLAAVNLDGTVRWQTNLVDRYGKDTLFWDHGTSPVLTEESVIMTRMHKGESWIASFGKETGALIWKTARNYQTPTECDHGYTTPIVIDFDARESILTWGGEHLTIHDAATGTLKWSCGNFNPEKNKLWPAIATPVIVDDTAVICFGRNDRNLPQMHGIKISGMGDVSETNHRWIRDDISSFVPSPIAYQNKVYLLRDRGEVECVSANDGSSHWSQAFPKSRTNFYATPLIAGGKLYAAREDGIVFVAAVNNDGMKLLSENDMDQPVIGSPVPMAGKILIRGEKEIRCYSAQ